MAKGDSYKGAILIIRDGEMTKWFKTWTDSDCKEGKIEITFKDKDGERQTLVKEYVGTEHKILNQAFCEAIVKYWPKYDPQKHHMVHSAGHFHTPGKVKSR